MREERRDAADGAGLAFHIEHRDVALGRGVELQDLRNTKPPLELGPDVGPQAVAAAHPDPVLRLMRIGLGLQQVAAQLADILEQRALPADDLVPELARRKFLSDHDGAPPDQHRAARQHAPDAVIHRQAVVHPVARARVHHAGEPVAPLHQPVVTDVGGLGQPRGARGVDIQRPILDGRRPPLGQTQRFARASLDVAINAQHSVVVAAVRPDRGRARKVRQRGEQQIDELRGHDDVLRRDDIDAMGERGAGQIGIEQRDDPADAGDAKPDRHVVRPVRHEQTDRVALGETLSERPAGVSVRPFRECLIGQALPIGEQGRCVAESVGEFLDHDRKNPMRVTGDRRRQLERARPCLESRTMVAPTRRRGGLGVARAHRRCSRPTSPREYDRQIIVATRVSQ